MIVAKKKQNVGEGLTFKDFLRILDEGAVEDIAKLQSDISLIDTQINQRTAPLILKKQQLQKLLMMKQKQAQAEQKRGEMKTEPQSQQTPQASQQAAAPGSTGGGTPGVQ